MPKLTQEQKALNKEAVKLRQKAYAQRYKEYRAALEAASNAVNRSAVAQEERKAQEAFESAFEARNRALADIQSQIDELTIRLEETKRSHDVAIAPIAEARKAASNQLHRAALDAAIAVKAEYPDMVGCWTAAAWKPLEEFLPLVSMEGSPTQFEGSSAEGGTHVNA